MPIRQSELELEVLLEYLLSLRRNLTTNNAALDSLRQPCCISRRVCDLTRRLEDHKIEYQHRYRRSRKSSTGCGGLRALYISIVQLAERQAPTLLIAVRVRVLMLTWENSIKEMESSLLNSLLITHTTSYSLRWT